MMKVSRTKATKATLTVGHGRNSLNKALDNGQRIPVVVQGYITRRSKSSAVDTDTYTLTDLGNVRVNATLDGDEVTTAQSETIK